MAPRSAETGGTLAEGGARPHGVAQARLDFDASAI